MKMLATLVLINFVAREIILTLRNRSEGYHPFWTIVGGVLACSLLIPLWAVWS